MKAQPDYPVVPPASHPSSRAREEGRERLGRVHTVLLVEDDSGARGLFETSLSLGGYRILTADRASVAILKALHFQPDVVVTDIVLPGADGCDLAVALRKLPETDHIPIVAVTGAAVPSMRAKIASVRFDRVLQKPCAPEQVTEAVDALLSVG